MISILSDFHTIIKSILPCPMQLTKSMSFFRKDPHKTHNENRKGKNYDLLQISLYDASYSVNISNKTFSLYPPFS